MTSRIYYSEEAEKRMQRQRLVDALMFTGIGIGIGSAAALLLAPNSGEKTRELITETLEEGFERGREATDEALSQLEQEVPNLRERVNELVQKIKS
ncbi:MAG: YtxH domain-containing protein [Chloroflexi bacterium]|nr:YtxH domain-containing protein [Chloroflexota bacterium]